MRISVRGEAVSSIPYFTHEMFLGKDEWFPSPFFSIAANPFDAHFMDTVLFVMDATRYAPKQHATPSPLLDIQNMPTALTASVAPYRQGIQLNGSNFGAIDTITWKCIQPNGTVCLGSPYIWTRHDDNWNNKANFSNDISGTVYPQLLVGNDPPGTYSWTVTFSGASRTPISKSFTVVYEPQSAPGIVVESLSSPSFTVGTKIISTTTNPVVPTLTVTGKNLGTVARIEWRWSGAATGASTWRASDPTWSSKVAYTPDGRLTLFPIVVEENPAWRGTTSWTGTLLDVAGVSQNIAFAVVYQSPTASPPMPPSTSLNFTSPSLGTITTSTVGYQPMLIVSGNVTQVTFSWSGATTSGNTPTTWVKNDPNWQSKVTSNPDGTITLKPVVTQMGDPSGTTNWTVTIRDNTGGIRTQSFSVNYTPAAAAPTLPAIPASLSPGSTTGPGPTLGSSAVTVSWNASSGATSYIGGIMDLAAGIDVVTISTSGTSIPATLSPGKHYLWYVYACNGSGCSNSSALYHFQTPAATGTAPAVPTGTAPGSITSPGPTTSSTTVALSWSAVSGATSYSLGVRDVATGALVVDTTVSGTAHTASLNAGRQYRWDVRACNSAGCSAFSTDLYFQTPASPTPLAIPTNLSPGATSSPGPLLGSSAVTVSWNASSGATLYIGGIRDIAAGVDVVTINTSGTSTAATLSPGKQYRWYVFACNNAGCSSSSALYYFRTP